MSDSRGQSSGDSAAKVVLLLGWQRLQGCSGDRAGWRMREVVTAPSSPAKNTIHGGFDQLSNAQQSCENNRAPSFWANHMSSRPLHHDIYGTVRRRAAVLARCASHLRQDCDDFSFASDDQIRTIGAA